MPDWSDLLGIDPLHRFDKDEVKAQLPLEFVCLRAGIDLQPSSDGRLVGFCPFHPDGDSPAFAVFTPAGHDDQPLSSCGCWSCDFQHEDVYGFLMRMHSVQFPQALQMAGQMLREFERDYAPSWKSRAGAESTIARPKANPHDVQAEAYAAWQLAQHDNSAISRLIDEKQQTNPGWEYVTAEYLVNEWWLGVEDDWKTVVPHYADLDDGQGTLARGLKTRTPRSHLIARPGADLSNLYGAWRIGRTRKPMEVILVCEGESDTWCAAARLGDQMDVVGLPSGAGARLRDDWKPLFKDKRVILAFDGDLAGRRAASRWHHSLRDVAASVLVATMPDGRDLAGVQDLVRVVMGATPVPSRRGVNVEEEGGVYVRVPAKAKEGEDDKEPAVISNWAFAPTRELTFEDGSKAWEGIANGSAVILRSQDLESEPAITKWAGRVGGNWLGSKRDAQALQGLLQSEGPFLGRGRATSVIGWHDGHFVLPDGFIGHDYWRYVPPPAAIRLRKLRIQDGPWDPRALDMLLNLRGPEVMHPVLAWVFATPLRSLFPVFPFLAVTGQSGSGKTTLVRAVLDALGWNVGTTITSTTPHGVQSFAGATNGLPVWFDEYRPGSREDSKQALDQVLRDAYDGTPGQKGGGSENKLALTEMPTDAPIVVTGEDAFSETSHIERMIWVKLARGEGSRDALEALVHASVDGLGKAYLTWLVTQHAAGALPDLRIRTTVDRRTTNLQVLAIGWELFRGFYEAATGGSLPAPNLSQHRANMETASATDPTTEALVWAQGRTSYGSPEPLVETQGDNVVVRLEDFVAEVRRARIHTLPGGPNAIAEILKDNWSGFISLHPVTRQRIWVLPNMADRLRDATAQQ